MIINEDQKNRIEDFISYKLENSTTITEVRNWLENFDEEDYDKALAVFENIEYFSTYKAVKNYNEKIKIILDKYKTKNIVFIPIGAAGKSGAAMVYYVKQAPITKDRRYKRQYHYIRSKKELELVTIPKTNVLIVLVDDFLGSGQTAYDFIKGTKKEIGLNHYLKLFDENTPICILSIVVMADAIKKLKSIVEEEYILGERRHKSFSSNRSVFGYRPKMIPVREFCYKYGKRMQISKKKRLGYDNSQALTVFSHTTPNNTLPIIWMSKSYIYKGIRKEWIPLFPRFGKDKIAKAALFRKENWLLLNSFTNARIQGFEDPKSEKDRKISFMLIGVIGLIRKNRSVPIICQIMGITLDDYGFYISEGQKRGLFLDSGSLSSRGKWVYDEWRLHLLLKAEFKRYKNAPKFNQDILYVPKIFRGKT